VDENVFNEKLQTAKADYKDLLKRLDEKFSMDFIPEKVVFKSGSDFSTVFSEFDRWPGVYVIFTENELIPAIVNSLNEFRSDLTKNCSHKVPNVSSVRGEMGCIYVGKSEDNLKSRLMKHLACPEGKYKSTWALKMNLWAKLEEVNVYLFKLKCENIEDKIIISQYENALRAYFKPAVGE
jgi:hypothetical protein